MNLAILPVLMALMCSAFGNLIWSELAEREGKLSDLKESYEAENVATLDAMQDKMAEIMK